MSGKAMAAIIAALAFGCLLAIGVLFATGAQAQGEQQCGPRADVVKGLKEKYHEVPLVVGVVDETTVMELYVSSNVEHTWTVLYSTADGRSCIMSVGKDYAYDTSSLDEAKRADSL